MSAAHEVDLPSPCVVPTAYLSKYGPGTIIARWRNKVAVDFAGHLGHYTVARHVFLPVSGVTP